MTRMIAEAIAGLSKGMIILEKMPILLHPSSPADSMSSLGISAMKPVINHVTKGSDKQLSVNIGARYVPVRCMRFISMNRGIKMVMEGTILPSNSTFEILLPIEDLQSLRPYAAIDPKRMVKVVVLMEMMALLRK